MKKGSILTTIIIIFCAFISGAQNFTDAYVAAADSADRCIKKEQWAEAERLLIKALREEPANKSNYLLWANLGMVRTNLDNLPGALQAYDIGLSSAPRSTTLLTNRAATYIALGHPAEALSDLNIALTVDSTLQKALRLRGIAHVMTSQKEKAEADFDRYENNFGKDAGIQELRGDRWFAEGKYEEALPRYKESYELEEDEGVLLKLLTSAFLSGKLEEEKETIGKGLTKNPRNGNLYLFRAALSKQKYQTGAAESDLKTARDCEADPRIKELLFGRR